MVSIRASLVIRHKFKLRITPEIWPRPTPVVLESREKSVR